MMKKHMARILSFCLLAQSAVLTATAADPKVETVNGTPTVFVSSFGRMSYDGQTYTAYKDFNTALGALGKDGGRIVFTADAPLSDFVDTEGRGSLTLLGVGKKPSGNTLDFTGRETVEFKGDLYMDMLNIKADPNAVLLTGGYDFSAMSSFDTSFRETYAVTGNTITYPAPLSVAPGNGSGNGSISIDGGVFLRVSAGAYNADAAKGTKAVLTGGTFTLAVAGNDGSGKTDGNTSLTVSEDAEVETVYIGSKGGTVNGSVLGEVSGGVVKNLIIGTESGAVIDGSLTAVITGGEIEKVTFINDGKVNGKTVLIADSESMHYFDDAKADYILEITAGKVEPVVSGNTVSGFAFYDQNGIRAASIQLDGTEMQNESGVFAVPEGKHTVAVDSRAVELKRDANFVAGYDDGTFRPQNNMTRAEAVTIMARLLADDEYIGSFTASYSDVAADAWYNPYIGFLQQMGLLDPIARDHGYSFAPDEKITRGEFTQLIYSIYGLSNSVGTGKIKLRTLSDVNESTSYVTAIYGAVDAGLVAGYDDGTFRSKGNITRAEVVTMVNRLLNRVPTGNGDTASFSDVENHWAKAQVLAACGKENVEWTEKESAGTDFVLNGSTPEEYIKGLYEQSATLNGDQICNAVDVISEKMKQDVLNSENALNLSDRPTTYYISEKNGNDDNDGLSPEKPFKTLNALNKTRFLRNANILLERGGVYRGTMSISANLAFGAYGEGPKPVWIQSKRNYADPDLWVETEYPNVWKCTELLTNVGVIGFDHDLFDYSDDTYNELYGIICNYKTLGFMGIEDMNKDLQFYSDMRETSLLTPSPLYLYSTEGNPGKRFKSIEIGERINIVSGAPKNCRIDNISFKFTGAHAIGVNDAQNLLVTNCVFSWLGGSVLWYNDDGSCTCYGNAVETGACDGYYVDNCWFYQLYDTAVTHQCSKGDGNRIQNDVRYLGNLIEYCHWGIEFYNSPSTTTEYPDGKHPYTRITSNVYDAYNVVRNTGYGWGSVIKNRMKSSQGYCGSSLSDNYDETTEYNIFDRSAGNLLFLPSNANEIQRRNIYIQYEGNQIGSLRGQVEKCDTSFASYINKLWGDKEAVVIMIQKKS